jgi:hypothetical protein
LGARRKKLAECLIHAHTHGNDKGIELIVSQAIRFGEPIPDRIANAPDLEYGLVFYLKAWTDLNADRSFGMSVGPIPTIAILNYAKHYQLSEDETERTLKILRYVDNEYLNKINSESKSSGGNTKNFKRIGK